jgi:hypothetical protein
MTNYIVIAIVATVGIALALVRVWLRAFVKTSVKESIKHEFEVQRQQMRQDFEREQSALERKDRFRLAALDRRLDTHQRAFSLAIEMMSSIHLIQERTAVVEKCETFWKNYCLFLGNRSRQQFKETMNKYFLLDLETKQQIKKSEELFKMAEELLKKTESLANVLAEEVNLEAMGSDSFLLTEHVFRIENDANAKLS